MVSKNRTGRKYNPLSKKEKKQIIQSRKQGIKNKDIFKVINKPLSTIQSCSSFERKDCFKDYVNGLKKHQTQNIDSEKKIIKQISQIVNDAIQQKKFLDLLPINKQQTLKNNIVRRKNRVVQQCLYFVLINRPPQYFQLTPDDVQEIIRLSQAKVKNQKIAIKLNKTLNIVQMVVENYKQKNERKFWQDKIIEKINQFYSDLDQTFQTLQENIRHQYFENKQVDGQQSFLQQLNENSVLDQFDANDELDLLDSNAYQGIKSFQKTINSEISDENNCYFYQKNEELSFLIDQFSISMRSDESRTLF